MPKLSRSFLLTGLLAVLPGAVAPATAQRAAPVIAPDFLVEGLEAIPPALRLAAAHHLPPLASLRTAEEGARDSLEALAAWNAAGRLPTQTGFTRPLPGAPRVRLTSPRTTASTVSPPRRLSKPSGTTGPRPATAPLPT